MTDSAPMPVDVAASVVTSQVKAQVRIILAAAAGAMVGKHILPASMNNDAMLDAVCALIFGGIAAGWQWARTQLEHSRWWRLAVDPRVPADLVRPDVKSIATVLDGAAPAPPAPSAAPFQWPPVDRPASPNRSAAVPIDPLPEVPASTQEQPNMGIIVEIEDDVLSFLRAAGKAVETFALSEGQKLVAAAKETFVGTAVTNIISALESNTMSGAEKMETVVTAAIPLVEKLVASGGIGALVTSVEDFALEFCQSAYNDFKAAAEKALGGDNATANDTTAQAA